MDSKFQDIHVCSKTDEFTLRQVEFTEMYKRDGFMIVKFTVAGCEKMLFYPISRGLRVVID